MSVLGVVLESVVEVEVCLKWSCDEPGLMFPVMSGVSSEVWTVAEKGDPVEVDCSSLCVSECS